MTLALLCMAGDPRLEPASLFAQASDTPQIQRGRPTVLVVDDEELIVDTISASTVSAFRNSL
jgi:hypothetical protein